MGYHGWHDWYQYTSDSRTAGIPKQKVVRADHGISLKTLFDKNPKKIACVIMEPYIWKELSQTYLKGLRRLCDDNGTVLIFDECITGFRTKKFSAQAMYDITPDMTVLSKAMANGFPISCICGKRDLMEVLDTSVFVSGTFNADLVGITAAITTLKFIRDNPVIHHIWTMGGKLQGSFNAMVNQPDMVDLIKSDGLPCRPRFVFPSNEHKSLFWQECLKRGVMLDDAQFISWAHKTVEMDKTLEAMRGAMRIVRKYLADPASVLEGDVCSKDFK
jgi:glutamate-1-semialdehyde aminotransferase